MTLWPCRWSTASGGLGQITVDDVMDQVREQSERDYQLASGIASDVDADDFGARPDQSSSAVAAIGIAGGLLSSVIPEWIRGAAGSCDRPCLFPIPLIGGTGGNVGVRASAIVVQGLANGRLDLKEFWHQLWKELRISLLNGVVISVAVFLLHDVYRAWRLGSDRGGGFLALP